MATYDFTLTFSLPDASADPKEFIDALFESGCDDATVGVGLRGTIGLDFSRSAISAEEALWSAIKAVQRAIPGASLVEVKPDLVNLSDAAALVGCSRQNIRKYAVGEIRGVAGRFPVPAVSGSTPLWHFYEMAVWLRGHAGLAIDRDIAQVSRAAYMMNLEVQRQRVASLPESLAAE
jgi:hypothetical protein